MNRAMLLRQIAAETGTAQRDVARILNLALANIEDALLSGLKVRFNRFGRFEVRYRQGRTVINPRTKEPMAISGRNHAVFVPSKVLRVRIRKGGGA